MWQFILRVFGRSKVEPVKEKVRDDKKMLNSLQTISNVATEMAELRKSHQAVENNVRIMQVDPGALERMRNRNIANPPAPYYAGKAPLSRRSAPAVNPMRRSTDHRTTQSSDDTGVLIPITMHNTYHGNTNDHSSKACNTDYGSPTDSGSSDSGSSCGSSSD